MGQSWIGKLDIFIIVAIVAAIFVGFLYTIISKDKYKDSYIQLTQEENVVEYSVEYKFGSYYRLSDGSWIKEDSGTIVERPVVKEIE